MLVEGLAAPQEARDVCDVLGQSTAAPTVAFAVLDASQQRQLRHR
jgi:hypothetical protein